MTKTSHTGMEFTHSTCVLTTNRNLERWHQPIVYFVTRSRIHLYRTTHIDAGPRG